MWKEILKSKYEGWRTLINILRRNLQGYKLFTSYREVSLEATELTK